MTTTKLSTKEKLTVYALVASGFAAHVWVTLSGNATEGFTFVTATFMIVVVAASQAPRLASFALRGQSGGAEIKWMEERFAGLKKEALGFVSKQLADVTSKSNRIVSSSHSKWMRDHGVRQFEFLRKEGFDTHEAQDIVSPISRMAVNDLAEPAVREFASAVPVDDQVVHDEDVSELKELLDELKARPGVYQAFERRVTSRQGLSDATKQGLSDLRRFFQRLGYEV